nr:hypothetical protein [Elizabethkingia sp. ASV34]
MAQITTYTVDAAKRRILTVNNMEELGLTDEFFQNLLKEKLPQLMKYKTDEKGNYLLDSKNNYISLWPVGVSINDKKFGEFPDPNAAQRGWMSFFEIGAPLFEERSNIIQPTADVISTRAFENRALEPRQFSDTVQFTIANHIHWSFSSSGNASVEGRVAGELQGAISQSIETSLKESLADIIANADSNTHTQTHHDHNHKDEIGTQDVSADADKSEETTTTNTTSSTENEVSFKGTGTALGRGELAAIKGLSLTGSISGTVTTTWASSSNVSGDIAANARIETLVTQRRQVKQFTYEVPITFDGYIGLNYDEFVYPTQDGNAPLSNFGPAKIVPDHISVLDLLDKNRNKLYRPIGIAETVSTLDVNHTIFESKILHRDGNQKFGTARPHNL